MNMQPEWLAGLVGVISPLIVRWIAKANMTRRWKSITAILVSTVIGFASAFLSGQFNLSAVLQSVADVGFPIAVAVYLLFVFGNKLDRLSDAVEKLSRYVEGLGKPASPPGL
jgi:uncharacterized membrane protein